MAKTLTYCQRRLAQYGITDEFNRVKITVTNEKADYKRHPEFKNYPIFSESQEGDGIDITYLHLNGSLVHFHRDGSKRQNLYKRTRLNPATCPADQKYTQPAKSGVHVHLNPRIIEKFGKAQKIKTLFMVEGEFKHWLAYMNGIDIIGLPSIHAYKEKDTDELHETIRDIIRVCKVEDLVMIYDADIFSVKWDKWEVDPDNYDLGKRANMFYSSARNIRDYAKRLVKDVYICHVSTDYLNCFNESDSVKGLDDLYLYHKGKESEVSEDLLKLRSSKKMFSFLNVTAESPGKIREFFRLRTDKDKKPEQFYNLHQSRLQEREFTFLGFKFKYSNLHEKLEVMKHPHSNDFIRVGCDYVKIIKKPELIRGIRVTRRLLKVWKAGEITRDYVNKGYKNFFDTIQKFDAFTNYPDNTEKYKQVIENCYNMYYQNTHVPEEGKFDNIKLFIEHLFQTPQQIDMAYDYLTILYRLPHENLPILALVSEARGTGKTKFLEFLREAFCENATILGNDAITDNFNDDYAPKLIIGIDEGLIEKKATVEKIKSWSTATYIKMNAKFSSREEIPFYAKIVITSNNTDSFVQIEDEETRFWVVDVPKVKKEDPFLMEKMIKEIPAFLHWLKSREIIHKKETRQWFANHLLETKALKELKENSLGWLPKELKSVVEEEFSKYQYHQLCYTLTEIMELLNGRNAGARFRASEARRCLEKKFKVKARLMRPQFPNYDSDGKSKTLTTKSTGRYYQFYIEAFLDFDTVKEIGYNLEYLVEIHKGEAQIIHWPGQVAPQTVVQTEMPLEDGKDIVTPLTEDNKDIVTRPLTEDNSDLPF